MFHLSSPIYIPLSGKEDLYGNKSNGRKYQEISCFRRHPSDNVRSVCRRQQNTASPHQEVQLGRRWQDDFNARS